MAITTPSTAKEISQKAKVDVKRELTSSDPFLARSYLGAIISGISNRVFEFYLALRDSEDEANPATAVRNLARWANIWSVNRLTGTTASGSIFVNASSGGSGTLIPTATNFVAGNGNGYTSISPITLAAMANPGVASITQAGGVATVTTSAAHEMGSNAIITMSGATQTAYNLTDVAITVTSATTFTYEVDATTPSPATGSPAIARTGGVIPVVAQEVGKDKNLIGDSVLKFEAPIGSVETSGNVTAAGIVDGVDVETDDELRARLLSRIQNPVTAFNVSNIDAVSKEEAGVTRVFVQERTPAIGQVTVFFMRDNDVDPIPSAGDLTNVKNRLLTIKPAHMSAADLVVSAPIAVTQNFVFSALNPATDTMKAAITTQLEEYFDKVPEIGTNVLQDAYRSVIYNTVDTTTGQKVVSFTLGTPASGNITVAAGRIAQLGTVTFP